MFAQLTLTLCTLFFSSLPVHPLVGVSGSGAGDASWCLVCVVLIAFVNCYSVRLAAQVQVIFTGAKIIALFVIIIGGIVRLGQGESLFSGGRMKGTGLS